MQYVHYTALYSTGSIHCSVHSAGQATPVATVNRKLCLSFSPIHYTYITIKQCRYIYSYFIPHHNIFLIRMMQILNINFFKKIVENSFCLILRFGRGQILIFPKAKDGSAAFWKDLHMKNLQRILIFSPQESDKLGKICIFQSIKLIFLLLRWGEVRGGGSDNPRFDGAQALNGKFLWFNFYICSSFLVFKYNWDV